MTIQEVYDKYKHLDELLSDKEWIGYNLLRKNRILFDLWQAIKEEIEAKGIWSHNDLRRAFVAGAKWWEFKKTGFTMWQEDKNIAEKEAERRYKEEVEESEE